MGHTFSMTEKSADSEIRAVIKASNSVRRVKLLLYGTGECGKTTISRQMRLAYGDDLKERFRYRGLICLNTIEGCFLTVEAGRYRFDIPFEDNPHADLVMHEYRRMKNLEYNKVNLDNPKLVHAIVKLYESAEFQEVLKRRNEYQLQDGWEYFAQKLAGPPGWPAWGGKDWEPSPEDLLHARIRTTGKITLDFEIGGTAFQLIDIGGQRSERVKFLGVFSQIDALLYVASLSEYNQNLFEDNTRNRLTETLEVWRNTVNHKDFSSTAFILFMNKMDLFVQKYYSEGIAIEPEFVCDVDPPKPEEELDENCERAKEWFKDLFLKQVRSSKRGQVRVYFITAMDRKGLKKVMDYCTTYLTHHGVGTMSL